MVCLFVRMVDALNLTAFAADIIHYQPIFPEIFSAFSRHIV
jgi:hypothetical protein